MRHPMLFGEAVFGNYTVDSNGCWNWKSQIDVYGYGKVGINGKRLKAHRVFYEKFKGPIPKGLVIDHLCRNRKCVNPDHMEAVKQGENVRRGIGNPVHYKNSAYCKRGHERTPENTYVFKTTGQRTCLICMKDRKKLAAHPC